jgi:hypothetical protein
LIRSLVRPTRPPGHVEAHLGKLGTETEGGILDIHRSGKTHNYLCCQPGRTSEVAKDGLLGNYRSNENSSKSWKPKCEGFGHAYMTRDMETSYRWGQTK